jgi:hypothetical protein
VLNLFRNLRLLLIFQMFLGCASGQTINLTSVPSGAIVYVGTGANGKRQKIGPTPAKYNAPSSEQPISLYFEAQGYVPKEVVMSLPFKGRADLNVQMSNVSRDWFRDLLKTDLANEVNVLMDELNAVQSELASKGDAESERILVKLGEKYSRFSLFHITAGNFYFARKKYPKAKFHFLEVLKLNTDDVEARNMLAIIDRL